MAENLTKHIKDLKEEYRKIFKNVSLEVVSVVENMSDAEAFKYLSDRLNALKKNVYAKIQANRDECGCVGCGMCCKFAVSQFSFEELCEKSKNGDNFASQFVSVFVPYKSEDEYKDLFPEYIELLKDSGKYYVYHCPKVTEDNRCPDYENRPQICKDFPDNPVAFLPLSCGFWEWKLKSESVWLKLVAETEIINHLLGK